MFQRKSKLLLISSVLGIAYTTYLLVHFFGGTLTAESDAEFLGFALAMAFVMPHLVLVIAATLLNLLAFILNLRWMVIVTGILYVAAGVVFLLYFVFVAPMIVLSFAGAVMVKKIKDKIKEKDTHIFTLADDQEDEPKVEEEKNTHIQENKTGGHEAMDKREPGHFRRKMFGGFHRKDVLAYITAVYEEVEQFRAENEALRQRCDELENLLQNLDKASTRGLTPKPNLTLRPSAEAVPDPHMQPEVLTDAAPAPAYAPIPEPAPAYAQAPVYEAPPVPAPPPEPAPVYAPAPEAVPAPAAKAPVAVPPVAQKKKPGLANPYSNRPARPARVKVKRANDK